MNQVMRNPDVADAIAIEREPTPVPHAAAGDKIVEEICNLDWNGLSADELMDVAWVYYYFSVQFRENLLIAREVHPEDKLLEELERGECDTDNLSPFPGVVAAG